MFEFLFLSNVNDAGLPARGRPMIQPATENKYRFHMQVSARAMGGRDHSLRQPNERTTRSVFGIFERWIVLASAKRGREQMVVHDYRRFEDSSQMRDMAYRSASTGGWRGCCRR
jgi:hypothetical protein